MYFLPNHPDHGQFRLAPLSIFLEFVKSYAKLKTGKISDVVTAKTLFKKFNNIVRGMSILTGGNLSLSEDGFTLEELTQRMLNVSLDSEGF